MSLVVLRSWTDGPPKVRGIAPSDSNEKYVYVPDHRGQFVTEEVVTLRPQNPDQKVKAGAIRRQTWNGDRSQNSNNDEDGMGNNGPNHIATVKETIRMHEGEGNGDDEEGYNYGNNAAEHERSSSSIGAKINGSAGVCRRRVGGSGSDCKSSERNYKSLSYIDLNSEERVEHISKSTTTETIATSKNRWANETRKPALLKPNKSATELQQQRAPSRSSSISPDNNDYIHELDSTPPASPMLNGRYRNLGPELAACIPKRQLKFTTNWLRDGPNSLGYQWSHQRRSLSNSTPSLSQDFYSSEEEKISSFSSQSSSKTSSPQPPSPSIRQLQRQFEKQTRNHHNYKEPEGSITEEEQEQVISPSTGQLSDFPWADGASRLKKIDKSLSPVGKNYYNRRPRQRQLVSSPSTPPPPPPDQHDYYRSLSSTPSGTTLENSTSSYNKDELDSPGKLRGVLGKQLSLSSEDETNESNNNSSARAGSPGKSDVILVEVIRKKLKAKNNNNNSQTGSSGFSASGSDSGSDKDSIDSGCHQSIISRKSATSEGKSLKSILKNSVTSTYASTTTASPQRNEEVVKDKVKSEDVNENLCEFQLVRSTEAEQIEQDRRSSELVDKNICIIATTEANKTPEQAEEQQKDHQQQLVSTSPPSLSSLDQESKIIRNRESEVFDSVIASTVVAAAAVAVESERKETEGAEIQDGVEKGVEKSEEGEEALEERPPVEIVPSVRNNDEAQFSTSSSSNSEQNPRLSALPIITTTDEKIQSATTTDDCCGTNQSESIQQQTAKDESVNGSSSVESDVLLLGRSETNVEVASRILDQVLTQAERTIEQISSNKSSVSSVVESTPMDRGKFFEDHSPIASVKIPVQAVNKYVRSDSSDEFESDFIWRKSSVRESFRGFCQELLESSSSTGSSHEALNNEVRAKATEKIVIHVSQPHTEPQSLLPTQAINEGVIEFEDDDDADHHHHHDRSGLSSRADRAETPMQQCNNSIEYISVRDNVQQVNGAVNAERSSRTGFREPGVENGLSINPQPIKWIITLDLGSRSSGFSYWGHVDQNVVHIGSWSGDNCLHKIPSWILTSTERRLSQKPESSVSAAATTVKIGQEALDEYMEQGESKCAFVNQWREFFQLDPEAAKLLTFPYTLDSAEDEMEFAHLITSLVNFFGTAAVSQMQLKFGPAFDKDEHVEWVITVPSGWNTHSRQCIREAAYKSSAIKDTDGVNLIEDPIAAAVFASMCGKYDNVMAVDMGGAFIHHSGFSSTGNGRLVQTLESNSLPLRTPESNFEQLLTQIVSREFMLYYKAKYKAGWVELLRNFERAKCKFDMGSIHQQALLQSSFTSSSAFVFFPSSFVTEFHGYTGMDLGECIQEQNSGITWNENGALRIPYEQMKQILKPTVDTVVGKIESALKEYDYDNLVLTGGCAKSTYLNETISAQFPGLKIILPKEFSSGVLQGATLSLMPNLEPKLLIKSPFSIGVGVMTPFDPNQHPEEKKIIKDGKTWCADVWDTLIKHGQDMEINSVVNRRAYVGAQPGQSCLVLPLFKSSASGVPKLVTDKSVLKCCELRFDSTKTWHEIDLILTCRASELIVMAVDRENLVHRVVIDIL